MNNESRRKINRLRAQDGQYSNTRKRTNAIGESIDKKLEKFDEKYVDIVNNVIEQLTIRKVEINNENIDSSIKILLTIDKYKLFVNDNIKDIRNTVLRRINKEKFKDMWER